MGSSDTLRYKTKSVAFIKIKFKFIKVIQKKCVDFFPDTVYKQGDCNFVFCQMNLVFVCAAQISRGRRVVLQ